MQGFEAKALTAAMVTFFLNWCDYCLDGGGLYHGGMESCSQEGAGMS